MKPSGGQPSSDLPKFLLTVAGYTKVQSPKSKVQSNGHIHGASGNKSKFEMAGRTNNGVRKLPIDREKGKSKENGCEFQKTECLIQI